MATNVPLLKKIEDLMGYYQNGTNQTLVMFADETTREYLVKLKDSCGNCLWCYEGDTLEAAIDSAYAEHGQDAWN